MVEKKKKKGTDLVGWRADQLLHCTTITTMPGTRSQRPADCGSCRTKQSRGLADMQYRRSVVSIDAASYSIAFSIQCCFPSGLSSLNKKVNRSDGHRGIYMEGAGKAVSLPPRSDRKPPSTLPPKYLLTATGPGHYTGSGRMGLDHAGAN